MYFFVEQAVVLKSKDCTSPPFCITQKYFPRWDLLQLHKCAQWQQSSCEGHSCKGAAYRKISYYLTLITHLTLNCFTHNCPAVWYDPLQADLQTSSQRLNLSASNSAVAELKPECCIDDVIHHEVKEIGTHMWVFFPQYTHSLMLLSCHIVPKMSSQLTKSMKLSLHG